MRHGFKQIDAMANMDELVSLPDELRDLTVHGETEVGWDERTPPNEVVDEYGVPAAGKSFGEPDVRVPPRRNHDDSEVAQLREHLRHNNGIRNLEICDPENVEEIARIFRRDGFVVVRDVLNEEQLERLRDGCVRGLQQILSVPGNGDRKYMAESGRLAHRYCYGTCSASRQMMHDAAWTDLIDIPTTTSILMEIFGTDNYLVWGGGGDLSIPGAIEYQHLHTDGVDAQEGAEKRLEYVRHQNIDVPEEKGFADLSFREQRLVMDRSSPGVTVNYTMCDLTWENGPIRQIPGTHTSVSPPPLPRDEPEWMRLSTLVGAPAGSGIFRDTRAWHGATPNLSYEIRALPSIEYSAGWSNGAGFQRSMPYEVWTELSPHAQKICRHIRQEPGVWPPGAGVLHPLASMREEAFLAGAGQQSTVRKVYTDPRSAGTAVRLFNQYAR